MYGSGAAMTELTPLRGGSWFIIPWSCRSASRDYYKPGYTSNNNGFSVISTATPPVSDRCPLRGGYWYNDDSRVCRSAYRNSDSPVSRDSDGGFRVISTAPKHD